MKNHKSHGTASKCKKRASMKALRNYFDREVTLIHENLDELKKQLRQNARSPSESELLADAKTIDDFYNSADDLFRQVSVDTHGGLPLEAQWYETYVLRKKKKKPPPRDGADGKKSE